VSVAYPLDGAVCEGVATADYDPFFPESREQEADALAMCCMCPVRRACLAFAVDTEQMFGIWGGRTQREVRSLDDCFRTGVRVLRGDN
jgi:WhiB family transcriptional regulator, redox-sensing transcriptional regulator